MKKTYVKDVRGNLVNFPNWLIALNASGRAGINGIRKTVLNVTVLDSSVQHMERIMDSGFIA